MLVTDYLYYVYGCTLCHNLSKVFFYYKALLAFVKHFLCILWGDFVCFFIQFIYIMDYIDLFLYIKPSCLFGI